VAKTKESLLRKTRYLVNRSNEGIGVGGEFIKRYREDVMSVFGKNAFQYLEKHLDAKEHTWRVASGYCWKNLERA
jgi:hypothetical protein